ncbi:MAG: YeeE/YedE family protein [Dehalococcoidia bacterium]|nr:MAG: YeeE/YedE family protein [Dehalococcoidia bacterium]
MQAVEATRGSGLPRHWWAFGVLLLPTLVYLVALQERASLAVFWAVGISAGFVIQRSRLCFVSGFRDLYLLHQGRTLRGLIIGLGIATFGFAMIMGAIVPDPATGAVPQDAHVLPVGIATVAGGLLFGVGMVLAGGCVSGSLYRMGEGYVASWVAMGGVMVGLFALNHTWNWWWDATIATDARVWLPTRLGYTGAIVLTVVLLAAAYIATLWWERRAPAFAMIPIKRAQPAPPASVGDDVRAALQRVFRKEWSPAAGAIALSLLNIALFIRYRPLGVVGEISRWANDFAAQVGQPAGVLKGLDTLAGCAAAVTGDSWVTDGFMLNGGIVVGSFTAAVLAREFRLRIPRQPRRYVQSAAGGVVMGYGAGLGLGCTLGAFYSAIPSLALNGWVYAAAMAAGALAGSQIIRRLT